MGKYVDYYCDNNNAKLKPIVDNIIRKQFGWLPQKDYDDFYSIAGQTVWYCESRFDESKNIDFEKYLKNSLHRKTKTRVTRLNRKKRRADMIAESMSKTIGENSELTIEDLVSDVEEITDETKLNTISVIDEIYALLKPKERRVIELSINGFNNTSIGKRLGLTPVEVSKIKAHIVNKSSVRRLVESHGIKLGGR